MLVWRLNRHIKIWIRCGKKLKLRQEKLRLIYLIEGLLTVDSIIIAGAGLPGLVIDLVWLATGLISGGRIDKKIVNSVNVDIVESIKSVSYDMISNNCIQDNNGIKYYLTVGESDTNRVREFYPFVVYSRLWSEKEYSDMYDSNYAAKTNISSLDEILGHYLPAANE